MTCKDCVNYEVCKEHDAMLGENKIDEIVGVEKLCEYFKPKSRFVEVVRCKDCEWFHEADDELAQHCRLYGAMVGKDDFCSYGEKALKERESK